MQEGLQSIFTPALKAMHRAGIRDLKTLAGTLNEQKTKQSTETAGQSQNDALATFKTPKKRHRR